MMKDSKKIPIAEPDLTGNELKYVSECIKSGWVSSKGKYITEFEEKFSNYNGMKYGISVSNGTTALHLALVALNIKEGDEVIIPNLTFIASANAVAYTGAKPVLVDVNKEDWNIDTSKIEEKITPKTKAIMPVHLYGKPCDMDQIIRIAKKHNLYVIEDCAEAPGAEYKGGKIGSFSDVSCFSFYGNKIITTGEGGMCLTNDEKLAERMTFLKNHGMSKEKKYWHPEIGFNYRMTNTQAAIGLAQLERIEEFIKKRRKNAELYDSILKNVKGITLSKQKSYAKDVCWLYSVLIEDKFGLNRDELIKLLEKNGIESRPFFYPLSQMPPYKTSESFPVSEELSKKGINLPSSTKLEEDEIRFVCKTISNSQ